MTDLIPITKTVSQTFLNGFIKAFSIRAAIGVLSRILELLRKNPKELYSFSNILGEKHLIFRVEAIRLGLFIGSFAGVYHLITLGLKSLRRKIYTKKLQNNGAVDTNFIPVHIAGGFDYKIVPTKYNNFIAGSIAGGISICFLSKDTRKTLALYALARALQSIAYSLEEEGFWKKIFPNETLRWIFVKNADALLFIVSSAQIMYSYVMRPHTLPSSYWNFIVKTGPIPAKVLEAARLAADRNYPIPLAKLGIAASKMSETAAIVPCAVLHGNHTDSCSGFFVHVVTSTIRKSWVMYLSLNAFSYVVLGFPNLIKNPLYTLYRASLATIRSTLFLSCFVSLYQAVICAQRKAVTTDHKSIYWIAGIISSLSIFIEKKTRREELGLHVFPRALDSVLLLYKIRIPPFLENVIYALSIGTLVHFYEHSPNCLASLVRSLFKQVLPVSEK